MTDREFLESKVGQKLRQLRGDLRRRLAGEGMSWLAIALVAVVFITLGLDYGLNFGRPMRGVVMGFLLIGVVCIVWRLLIAPLLAPMDNEQLALLVEERYGTLSDSLISALQFSRPDRRDTPGQSKAMVEIVIRQAGEASAPLDFRKVVERPGLRRALIGAVCAVVVLTSFSFLNAGIMNRWWNRNVAFADTAWPQDLYLDVSGPQMDENGNFRVLRGEDLQITVTARSGDESMPVTPPESIALYANYEESVGWTTEPEIKLNTDGSRTYTHVFRGVSEPFEFYFVCSKDKREERHSVSLIDPPGVTWLQFNIEYPAYMNRPAKKFDESRAVLAAPPGSTITIRATTDKTLDFASAACGMFLDGVKVGSLHADTAAPPSSAPRKAAASVVGSFQLGKLPEPKDGAKVNPMRTLTVSLQDTDGFPNHRAAQYKIRTEPDTAPRLSLKRRGVGSAVTSEAILPLVIQAKDDSGLKEIRAVLSWAGDKPGRKSWIVRPGPESKDQFDTLYELDIKDLQLKPGTTIGVTVEADDLMPAELGGPNKGVSGSMSFRIVKRDELLAEMVRRQKALRANFEQTVQKQEDSVAAVEASITMLGANQGLDVSVRGIRDSASMEIGVSGDCAKTSIAMGDILIEMVYNRIIEAKGRAEMLNGIVNPLAELAEQVDVLTARMKTAEGLEDPAELLRQAEDIRTEQFAILEVMRKVLEGMIKAAEAQELAYELERLIERWDDVVRVASTRADWDIQNELGFLCTECKKALGSDGGPGAKVKCPNCKKTVSKPAISGPNSD